MSAPADHIPSSFDASTQTSTSSSNRTSSTTALRSRIRSASYVFAFGLLSHAIATRPFFSRDMYVRSIGAPRAVATESRVLNARPRGSSPLENSDVVALRVTVLRHHADKVPARGRGEPDEL